MMIIMNWPTIKIENGDRKQADGEQGGETCRRRARAAAAAARGKKTLFVFKKKKMYRIFRQQTTMHFLKMKSVPRLCVQHWKINSRGINN